MTAYFGTFTPEHLLVLFSCVFAGSYLLVRLFRGGRR